jgi:hypothetical protein
MLAFYFLTILGCCTSTYFSAVMEYQLQVEMGSVPSKLLTVVTGALWFHLTRVYILKKGKEKGASI